VHRFATKRVIRLSGSVKVDSAAGLMEALESGVEEIEIQGTLSGMPMITLGPGVRLRGGTLKFGAKGLRLSSDNEVEGVTVLTPDHEVAILNDTGVADLGTLTLRDVRTTGQVLLVADAAVRAGHVLVEGLTVERADIRGRVERPGAFGVEALQGAFTLWNRQPDPDVVITAELRDIGVGSAEAPVRGSGVFVGGHRTSGPEGGTVQVSTLRTGEIHSDGGIAPGTPDLISGGVFVISAAVVQEVVNAGPVTTHGQNDMVLDNWGEVTNWIAQAPVTSHGPSGIGFVNFGQIDRLDVQAPIETFGIGARGFNLYDGSLRHASFENIATHGDGSVGVQVSKPLPTLEISGDLTTEGGEGQSLVKGVQLSLKAIALSIKPGADVETISVGGQVRTTGENVITVEIEGNVGQIEIAGGVVADGMNSDAIHARGETAGLDGVSAHAANGEALVRTA
jgi:hypothetical protein